MRKLRKRKIYLALTKYTNRSATFNAYVLINGKLERICYNVKVGGFGTSWDFLAYEQVCERMGWKVMGNQLFQVL